MGVTLSLPLPLTLAFPPHGLCEVGEEGQGQRGSTYSYAVAEA